jgi:hypothetical protein
MTTTELTLEEAAREAAGNWQGFDSFAWHRRREVEDCEAWTIVYWSSRDSGLLEQSNGAVMERELEQFTEGDDPDVVLESHGHWAVGHVDGASIRVYTPAGEVTEAFKTYFELQRQLEDYPVLDDMDYGNREYDATIENITTEGRRLARDFTVPDDWAAQVYSWLWDNDQREVENRDDQGGYASEDAIKRAFIALGFKNQEVIDMVEETAQQLRVDVEFLKTAAALRQPIDPQTVIELAERALGLVEDVKEYLN